MPEANKLTGVDTSIYAMPQQQNALQQLGALAQTSSAVNQADITNTNAASARLGLLHNELSSLVTMDTPTQADVQAVGSRLVANGLNSDIINRELQSAQALGNSPNAIKAWAQQHLTNVMSPEARYGAAYGSPQMVNLGDRVAAVNVNPRTNSVQPMGGAAGQMSNGMAPGDAASPVDTVDAQGNPTRQTKRQFVDRATGVSGLNNGYAGRGAQGAVAPTAPGGGVQGPGPNFEAGTKAINDDRQAASATMTGVQPLMSALPLLGQLGTSAAGPGSQAFNQIKSRLVTLGIVPAGATDAVVRQEAQKYLNQFVAKSGIAQRSDMGTLTAQASSPNLETSLPATIELTKNAIASSRAQAAVPGAFSGRPDDYLDFKSKFPQQQDLRAYRLDLMPDADRVKLVQQMAGDRNSSDPAKKQQAQRFFNSLGNADRLYYSAGPTNGQ